MSNHGHSCEGDHNYDDTPEMGIQYSLYEKIDMINVECLNESRRGTGKDVFKPWEERLNLEKFVESDSAEELLFNIPFTGNIKLKGIIVIGEDSQSHPSQMRIYKNRPFMTFDDCQSDPDQLFEMQRDPNGTIEYSTKVVKFSSVSHLSLYFSRNFGANITKIYYIGLRGEFMTAHRHGVTICTYEARPNVADHSVDAFDAVARPIL